jgi:beta-lactamase class A
MRIAKIILFIGLWFFSDASFAQTEMSELENLRSDLNQLIGRFDGQVGIGLKHLESGDTVTITNSFRYPMQSVYKFPLALAILKEVDLGVLTIDQKIHVKKEDLHLNTWSPLAKEYPDGNVDLTIEQLLNYTVSKSDNNTCDILFKILGGPLQVEKQMRHWEYQNISIQTTEAEMQVGGDSAQQANWCTPFELVRILEDFYLGKLISEESTRILMGQMTESANSSKRIKGRLPKGTIVAHKTGSGNKVVNDVGIIMLPDGSHLILSVFICNSKEEYEAAEDLVAKIASVAYDYFVN